MSRVALARIPPADRDRIRAAVRVYDAARTRRAVVVGGAAAFGLATIGVGLETMGGAGVAFGALVAVGLGLLARLFVRIERDRLFQQGFAGTGLTPAERASVLVAVREDAVS